MDPLAHALFGGALAKTPVGRRSPASATALVVASVAPDLDWLSWPIGGRDAWFKVQSGLSHSLLGMILLGLALVPFLRWLERRFFGRHSVFRAGGRPDTCAPAVLVGLALHVPLDLFTDIGAQPLTPFWDGRVRADLIHPTDPFLWLIFGGAAALAGKRSSSGSLALAIAAAIGTGLVWTHDASAWIRYGFPGACALIAWMRAAEVGRKKSLHSLKRAAGLAGLYVCLVIAGKTSGTQRAQEALAKADESAEIISVHPTFGNPLRWRAFAQGARGRYTLDVSWGKPVAVNLLQDHSSHPLARTALRDELTTDWRSAARLPAAAVELEPDGAGRVVLWDRAQEGRPWDEALRFETRYPAAEVERIHRLFEAAGKVGE